MLRCRRVRTSWWRRSGTSICTSLSWFRSAQGLVFTPSISQAPGSFGADGGTVGGSAYDCILFFIAQTCGAERGHSSSSWSRRSCRWERSCSWCQGRRHLCRGADAVSLVLLFKTKEILQLQFSVRRQSSSHSCSPLSMDTVVAMPVVVQRQMQGGSNVRKLRRSRSCSNLERGRCPCCVGRRLGSSIFGQGC